MSTRHRIRIATLAGALALGLAPHAARAAAPEIETRVSDTQVAQGEVFALQLRLRGPAASHEPDLAPLAGDFEVLDVQRGRRSSIVNGVRDESIDYVLDLVPRRAGDLVVPAIPIGSAASEPVALQVRARSAAPPAGAPADEEAAPQDAAAAQDERRETVHLDARVDHAAPYEQERVVLTLSLYADGDVLDGALGEPEVPGAIVQRLGEDRAIERELDGRRQRGVERRYTLVPEKPGMLTVSSIPFEGRVRVAQPARRPRPRMDAFGDSFFDDFFSRAFADDAFAGFFGGGTRTIAAESAPIRLEVRERPAAAAGQWWLPARDVSLREILEPAAGPLHVGESVTRKIEIQAKGAAPAQIPALPAPDVEGLKQYAEAPESTETAAGSVRVDQTTLIATRPGTVTLPAVELAWWDTTADLPRKAVIPARTIEVLPALGTEGPTGAAAPTVPAPSATVEAAPVARAPAARDARSLTLLAAAACAVAIAAFALGVASTRRRQRAAAGAPAPRSQRQAERALRRACKADDPVAAEAALRSFGGLRAGGVAGPPGVDGVATTSPALALELARLSARRYAPTDAAWSGAPLWAAWRAARNRRRSGVARDAAAEAKALPPLYPTP